MSYSPRQHLSFAERLGNTMRELRQLQIESVALQEIYATQTSAGTSPDFVDLDGVSADELRAAMDVAESYLAWLTGAAQAAQEDRRPVTTAFLQQVS